MKQCGVCTLPVLLPKCYIGIKHISLDIGVTYFVYWPSAFLLCSTIVSTDMSALQTKSLPGCSLPIQQNGILLKASHTFSPPTLWYSVSRIQMLIPISLNHALSSEAGCRIATVTLSQIEPLQRRVTPCDASAISKVDKIILSSQPPKQPTSSSY